MRTGERLDDGSALYRADLVRHRAAYRFADSHFERDRGPAGAGGLVLDLGCGTGYGAASLAASGHRVVALDRVLPDSPSRESGARFVRGDLERLPFAAGAVDGIASFQVIEHFADASTYLAEMARVLRPEGSALVSTPNRLQSDGENPYHLREYTADELGLQLSRHFEQVELVGIHAVGPAARYQADRLRQIRRVTRLDPLGLRRRIPRPLVEWAFAWLSVLVRVAVRCGGTRDEVGDGHYELGRADDTCLDLLAIGRRPVRGAAPATSGLATDNG